MNALNNKMNFLVNKNKVFNLQPNGKFNCLPGEVIIFSGSLLFFVEENYGLLLLKFFLKVRSISSL